MLVDVIDLPVGGSGQCWTDLRYSNSNFLVQKGRIGTPLQSRHFLCFHWVDSHDANSSGLAKMLETDRESVSRSNSTTIIKVLWLMHFFPYSPDFFWGGKRFENSSRCFFSKRWEKPLKNAGEMVTYQISPPTTIATQFVASRSHLYIRHTEYHRVWWSP